MQWFTTGVSTTLVLILLGIVSFFILFAQRLSDSVKENLTVTVLLDGEASRSDIHEFRTALKGERYVYALDYVSKEQALKEQVKAMGSDPSEFLGANPFTASFELRMNALYANSDSLAWITAKLKKNPLVEDVKLVGASWGFIRRPFMARSFNLGFLSGLLADAVLWGGVHTLLQYDPSLSQYIHVDMLLVVGAAVLLFGLLLTLGCTYVSVNKYLRMKVGDLY